MADKPRISADELTRNLVNARKIMNKVDTGDYETGNINENVLRSSPEELAAQETPPPPSRATRPIGKADPDKINQTRLPDVIKRAMIENPIPEITLNDTLDMDFVNKTRRLMEEDGSIPTKKAPLKNKTGQQINEQSRQSSVQEYPSNLVTLIENTIRRVLDEKLTQILNAQAGTTINESLAIKVGDSIFTGKITKVKNTK
jgi:hypothetical protein